MLYRNVQSQKHILPYLRCEVLYTLAVEAVGNEVQQVAAFDLLERRAPKPPAQEVLEAKDGAQV